MSAARRRDGLSGGEIAVVVVSLTLLVVFAVLALPRLAGNDEPGGAATPTPPLTSSTGTPTADGTDGTDGTADDDADGEDVSAVGLDFVTPSGNIACAVDADRALCVIAEMNYADQLPDAEVAACEGDYGHVLTVDADGARLVCDTSGEATAFDPSTLAVLDYGRTQVEGAVTCRSEETGMTCTHDGSGESFTVRRSAYTVG